MNDDWTPYYLERPSTDLRDLVIHFSWLELEDPLTPTRAVYTSLHDSYYVVVPNKSLYGIFVSVVVKIARFILGK